MREIAQTTFERNQGNSEILLRKFTDEFNNKGISFGFDGEKAIARVMGVELEFQFDLIIQLHDGKVKHYKAIKEDDANNLAISKDMSNLLFMIGCFSDKHFAVQFSDNDDEIFYYHFGFSKAGASNQCKILLKGMSNDKLFFLYLNTENHSIYFAEKTRDYANVGYAGSKTNILHSLILKLEQENGNLKEVE